MNRQAIGHDIALFSTIAEADAECQRVIIIAGKRYEIAAPATKHQARGRGG